LVAELPHGTVTLLFADIEGRRSSSIGSASATTRSSESIVVCWRRQTTMSARIFGPSFTTS
jgi:hypothetical protein